MLVYVYWCMFSMCLCMFCVSLCMFSVCLCVYGGGGVWVMEKNRRKFPNSFLLLTPAKDD